MPEFAWPSSLALALMGASRVRDLSMGRNAAMIYNPGSGDYAGFRIVIEPSGKATAIDGARRQ